VLRSELAEEFEHERFERLAEQNAQRSEDDPDWRERFRPGGFGAHEALHLAHVFGAMVDEHLARHPTVLLDPRLYALASEAAYALAELYQAIGAAEPGRGLPDGG
jgi:hypothetical protein